MTHLWPVESTDADPADRPNGDRQRSSRRSRRKAWRDGFAAQTVIGGLEDERSYRAFERAIVASIGPRSLIELELIHRLASLFWRLRRASAIETGLFGLQSAMGHEDRPRLSCILPHPVESAPRLTAKDNSPLVLTIGAIQKSAATECTPVGFASLQISHRNPSPWRSLFYTSPSLTRACWSIPAHTKRGCGARLRKRFGC